MRAVRYLTNLRSLRAVRCLTKLRSLCTVRDLRAHWAVENRLHWCLDTTFSEDACRIRTKNAAENLAVIRHFALSWLRCFTEDRLSLPRRRRRCDYSLEYRMRVLAAALG